MKILLFVLALASAGCGVASSEGNWRRVESSTEDWVVPPPPTETKVSPVLPWDQLSKYIEDEQDDGWDLISVQPAGPEFPASYIASFRARP